MGAVEVLVDEVYGRLAEMGLDYGPAFQGLRGAWVRGSEVFCEVALDDDQLTRAGSFGVHPALFDAALHAGVLPPDGGMALGCRSLGTTCVSVRLSVPSVEGVMWCGRGMVVGARRR